MGLKSGFRYIAVGYRNTARKAIVVLAVVALLVGPILGAASSASSTWPTFTVSKPNESSCLVGARAPTQVIAQGTINVTGGSYSGPITFNGTATVYYYGINGRTASATMTAPPPPTKAWFSNQFTIQNISSYPTSKQTTYKIVTIIGACPDANNVYYYTVTVTANAGGHSLGTQTIKAGAGDAANPTFQYIVELPLFNDTMLGASQACDQNFQPCYLPIGPYYNFLAIIAIIIAGIGGLIAFGTNQVGGNAQQRTKNFALDIGVTVIFILAFPYIYNQVANMMNYLNASIIAGFDPKTGAANPWNTFGIQLQNLWNAATGATNAPSLWDLIFGGAALQVVAAWFIDLFVWIGTFVLGVIRIWLLVVMIVAFPIGLALKQIPFAEKLSGMIEDTFYGLVLATLMSAIVLGVAANLFTYNDLNNTIFAGGATTFVAAMALLTALMMPTVFAPLTSTLFQTGMQMSLAAGSMATMMAAGVATGGAGGVAGLGGAAGGLGNAFAGAGNAAQVAGQGSSGIAASIAEPMSTGMKATHWAKGSLPHIGQNLLLAAGSGAFGAIGMAPAAKQLARLQRSPQETQVAVANSVAQQQAAQLSTYQDMEDESLQVTTNDLQTHPATVYAAKNTEGKTFVDSGKTIPHSIINAGLRDGKGGWSHNATAESMLDDAVREGVKVTQSGQAFAPTAAAHGITNNEMVRTRMAGTLAEAKADYSGGGKSLVPTKDLVDQARNGSHQAHAALEARMKYVSQRTALDFAQHQDTVASEK